MAINSSPSRANRLRKQSQPLKSFGT